MKALLWSVCGWDIRVERIIEKPVCIKNNKSLSHRWLVDKKWIIRQHLHAQQKKFLKFWRTSSENCSIYDKLSGKNQPVILS